MKYGNEKVKKGENIRADYDRNLSAIRDAIYAHIIETKGRAPSYTDLSERTGLSYRTIEKRYKEIEFKPMDSYFRLLTPDIIVAIANSAKKGSSASQKLWMQIIEGWSERTEITGKDGENLFQSMTDEELLAQINKLNKSRD